MTLRLHNRLWGHYCWSHLCPGHTVTKLIIFSTDFGSKCSLDFILSEDWTRNTLRGYRSSTRRTLLVSIHHSLLTHFLFQLWPTVLTAAVCTVLCTMREHQPFRCLYVLDTAVQWINFSLLHPPKNCQSWTKQRKVNTSLQSSGLWTLQCHSAIEFEVLLLLLL